MIKKENRFQNTYDICAFIVAALLVPCCFAGTPSHKASAGTKRTEPVFFDDARDMESFAKLPTAAENTSLPLCIPEVDKAPYFESVSVVTATGPAEGICFTGHVKDDIRLKSPTILIMHGRSGTWDLEKAVCRPKNRFLFWIRIPCCSGMWRWLWIIRKMRTAPIH